jgi:hypothetical protein
MVFLSVGPHEDIVGELVLHAQNDKPFIFKVSTHWEFANNILKWWKHEEEQRDFLNWCFKTGSFEVRNGVLCRKGLDAQPTHPGPKARTEGKKRV